MAWTTPLTAVANTALTAAQWNASVRDNLLMTGPALATTATGFFVATAANTLAQRIPGSDTVSTSQSTTSTSYTDLTTVGPSVTATTGVAALVTFSCWATNDTGGARSAVSYAMSGASSAAGQDLTSGAMQVGSGTTGLSTSVGRAYLHTSLTAGSTTFKVQYKASAGTGTFQQRTLSVIPF